MTTATRCLLVDVGDFASPLRIHFAFPAFLSLLQRTNTCWALFATIQALPPGFATFELKVPSRGPLLMRIQEAESLCDARCRAGHDGQGAGQAVTPGAGQAVFEVQGRP